MDKDRKEALQVAKELTAKFIETRTVSPGNFAEIFPAVYRVVYEAIRNSADETDGPRRERLSHFPIRPGFRSVPRP